MTAIEYVIGDATAPLGTGHRVIAHACNDRGGWGRGFVLAVSKRWRAPEDHYRGLHRAGALRLGDAHFVPVEADLTVANLIVQHGYSHPGAPAIDYDALSTALDGLAGGTLLPGGSVHMPRIGCGLAGGTWDRVEPLVRTHLAERGVEVTVYDLA